MPDTDHAFRSLRLEIFADPVEAGMVLLQAKQSLGHGHFLKWLEAHFPISAKSANRLMAVAQLFMRLQPDAQTHARLLQLEAGALYELAARSTTPEIEKEVLRRLRRGQSVRQADILRLKHSKAGKDVSALMLKRMIGRLENFNGWYEQNRDRIETALAELEPSARHKLSEVLLALKQKADELERQIDA